MATNILIYLLLYSSVCVLSNAKCTSRNCGGRPCDPDTGKCEPCPDGHYNDGGICKQCPDDHYIDKGICKRCNINCKDSKCNSNGTCRDGCITGLFGTDCQNLCSSNCKTSLCDHNGICVHCKDGFYGDICERICPNCKPGGCKRKDGVCIKGCKDGFYGHDGRCMHTCENCNPGGCQINNGTCLNGCNDASIGVRCGNKCSTCRDGGCKQGGVCINGCKEGFYGSDGLCLMECPNCQPGGCSKDDGVCNVGCNEGWYSDTCDSMCSSYCQGGCKRTDGYCNECLLDRYYGTFCNIACSSTCRGRCDRDGICNDCFEGYYGDFCNITCSAICSEGCSSSDGFCGNCRDIYYDSLCNVTCSVNCKQGCYRNDKCMDCFKGYYGDFCNISCSVNCKQGCYRNGKCIDCFKGFYGDMCNKTCGNCKNYSCNINGICIEGCTAGKTGQYCDKNCFSGCISCKRNSTVCLECKKGWRGTYCDHRCLPNCINCHQHKSGCMSCKRGWFGSGCNNTCPTGCWNSFCNMDGTCDACKPGYYGKSCDKTCNNNCKSTTDPPVCNSTDGSCTDGCNMDGTCSSCKPGYYGKICDKKCSSTCRSTKGSPICNYSDGSCIDGCVRGKKGNNCSEDCPEGWYGLNCFNKCGFCKGRKGCNVSSGECSLWGCQEQYTGPTCHEEKYTTADTTSIVAIVFTVVILMMLMMFGLYIWRNRKPGLVSSLPESVPLSNINGTSRLPNGQVQTNIESTNLLRWEVEASQPTTTRILLNDLWKYTHDKKNRGLFNEEYRKLPNGMCESHVVAMLPQNKLKNRYKDVCAYDHTRVILDKGYGNPASDYINACYISGYQTVKPAYIASQGPTPANINEFWRMIWVVEADKVVMLTNLVELGTSKCLQYWPLVDQKVEHGGISITTIREEIFSHFTIRTLQISRNGGGETRTIKQYHYNAWCDRTVPPDVVSLIEFRDKVVKSPTKHLGPIVVHCSAGIGRTGTFIALDYLMEEGKVEDSVDVFNCVSRMRHERVNMVQTIDQYCLLHEALAEWYLLNETTIPVTSYQPVVQNLLQSNGPTWLPQLQSLFQTILHACPKQEKGDFIAALSEENKNKNRDSTILASDKYRAYLITEVAGSNADYINAVHLPSYTRKGGFILTQTPLRNTVSDYWMLVADARVPIIIDIDPVDTGIKDSNPYLPSISTTRQFGPFLVTCTEEDVENGHYTINKYNVKHATNDVFDLDVKLYKCNFWKDDTIVPVSPAPIFNVLRDIHNSYMDLYDDPILVQCINGVDKSGLFCVLAGTIERLYTEETVNIVHVIQQLRRSRPQVITCYEQFRFCYEAIAEYLYDRSGYNVKSC